MFKNLNSKRLTNRLISFLFILILSLIINFAENVNSVSIEFNKTVKSITEAKLVGIYADGVNDSTNILDDNQYDFGINDHVLNKSHKTNGNNIAMKGKTQNLNSVQNYVLNTTELSDKYLVHQINEPVESTEPNQILRSKLCKKLDFGNKTEDIGNEFDSTECLLSTDWEGLQSNNYSVMYSINDKLEEIDFWYFNIPEKDQETPYINKTSYIAIAVYINCPKKANGEVLIIDEGSKQPIFHFVPPINPDDHCDDLEPIVSDSSKVRVEVALHNDPNTISPIGKGAFINKTSMEGSRTVSNSKFEMIIRYFEIRYDQNDQLELKPENEQDRYREAIYTKNSVLTFKLMPPNENKRKNVIQIGIEIQLEYLNIDIDVGDFLLIGPGSEPTHRELSKAQIITQNIEQGKPKKIWVNADSAYIRLVTHNSKIDKPGTALKFRWDGPKENFTEDNEENYSDRIKNAAIQICIMDKWCQHTENAFGDRFKEEMVTIANEFLFNKDDDNKGDETKKLVSIDSVLLFGAENGVFSNTYKNQLYCQVNLAITSAFNEQWPLVSHNTLHYIFFRGSDHRYMHSFGTVKVTDCSHESISLLKMILPIIVILIISTLLLFIAWRYQYKNWTQMQRTENAKYMSAPVGDPNEDVLYAKDNPIFVDDDNKITHTINKMDTVDGKPAIIEHKPLGKELSYESSSSRKLSSVKESPEFVNNLWLSPGTSRQQNEYVLDNSDVSEDKSDDIYSTTHTPININKSNTFSKSSGDTFTAQIPMTGLNGTQHESLRSYPKSALRRPTLDFSENGIPTPPETNPFRRPSKVQFELPVVENKQLDTSASAEETNE